MLFTNKIKILCVVIGSHHFVDGEPAVLADPAPVTLVVTVDHHVGSAGATHGSKSPIQLEITYRFIPFTYTP